MDDAAVTAALDELREVVGSDGGTLHLVDVDPSTRRVELRLDLSGVECVECVLPPDMMIAIVDDHLRRTIGEAIELVLHDPRQETNTRT
jgi:Fe-S cluster biogenesis protein NfuA